jgi:subtilase family serine protease
MLPGTKTWLRQTITHYPFVNYNSEGQPTFGTPFSVKCRVEKRNQNIISIDGNEVISTLQVYIDGSETFTVNDKIILSDNISPPILSIEEQIGPDGTIMMKTIYA